jgi:NodT family efflux transporter outer membrane factor (OMF) lipoprotein
MSAPRRTVDSGRSRKCRWTPTAMPAVIVPLAAIVVGCATGPEFTRPAAPSAARYTAEPLRSEAGPADDTLQHVALGREIEGNWWILFRSEAIDGIVQQALQHNRSLAASLATLQQARDLASATAGTRYPQVGLTGGVGRQKYGEEFLGGLAKPFAFSYFAVGSTVSYTLDYTGGVARDVERQYALAEVARHRLDAVYLSVSGQAVMQTIAIASTRAQIATLETILAQDRQNLALVETAFKNGSVAKVDVLSAQSEIVNDMTLLPPLRQELSQERHALSVTLGQVPASGLPSEIDLEQITLPLDLPVSLPSELAHRRPDILAAEAQLHAATSAVGVAQSNLYPQIQLSATLGQQALTGGTLFDGTSVAWSLISGLTAPLFDGGTLRAQKRAAVDIMHASAANYEQTVLEAFAQVADLLEALDHDAEELDAQSQAQQGALGRLELARASYQEGNTGILQVLDTERSYQRARLGYVRAVAQRYVDTVQLFLALGGTSPSQPVAGTPDHAGAS